MRLPVLLPLAIPLLLLAAPPAQADETGELWSGSVLSATFRAGMCIAPGGDVRGVFLLTHKSGQTDVYHVQGRRTGNEVEARHSSGHVFRVTLEGPSRMSGSVRLKNGIKLKLEGTRRQGVRLADDCAPLPQDHRE